MVQTMKRRLISLGVLFLFVAAASFAAPLTATWVEGDVTVAVGSSWRAVEIGDDVDSASVVRLGKNSYAEFVAGSRKIALTSEGTFKLDTLITSVGTQETKRAAVMGVMGRLIDRSAPRSTAVAGVRGDFEGAPETTMWATDEDDPETLGAEGRDLVAKQRYLEAAELFGRAATEALGDQRVEYQYSQAWCLAAANNAIGAIKILRPMNDAGAYAIPRAILLARLNLDTGAAKEAVALLDQVAADPTLSGEDAALVKDMREEARVALGKK